jgi:cobalt/nickel transport system ATP-binding protein
VSHHIIEARELCFSYACGRKVLDTISFTIKHGESVAIAGANGAGKSTLLLHFNGCLLPTSGQMRIGDVPVTQNTLKSIRRTVGMVFEDPDDQLFMPTVFEDVAFGPLNIGIPHNEIDAVVTRALSAVGALHLKDRPPYRLSDGEKRSVAIASVLSMSPDILVMDEPSSNLDPLNRRSLINMLKGFSHTIIIATHDLDLALDICKRTIIINNGKVEADGPTVSIMTDDKMLERNHLERPLSLQKHSGVL